MIYLSYLQHLHSKKKNIERGYNIENFNDSIAPFYFLLNYNNCFSYKFPFVYYNSTYLSRNLYIYIPTIINYNMNIRNYKKVMDIMMLYDGTDLYKCIIKGEEYYIGNGIILNSGGEPLTYLYFSDEEVLIYINPIVYNYNKIIYKGIINNSKELIGKKFRFIEHDTGNAKYKFINSTNIPIKDIQILNRKKGLDKNRMLENLDFIKDIG